MRRELLSLLEACKQEPDDDAARLVLADWLEEHGDDADRERAEFVRLEVGGDLGRGVPRFDRLWKDLACPKWTPFLADLGKSATSRDHRGLLAVAAAPKALGGTRAARWAGREE